MSEHYKCILPAYWNTSFSASSHLSQNFFLLYSELPTLSSAKRKQKTANDKFQHNFCGFKYLVIDKTLMLQLFLRPHNALENSNTLLQVWAPLCLFATNHFRCELRHKNEEFTFCFFSTILLFFSFPSKLNSFCHRLFPFHPFFTKFFLFTSTEERPMLRVALLTQITCLKHCSNWSHFSVF